MFLPNYAPFRVSFFNHLNILSFLRKLEKLINQEIYFIFMVSERQEALMRIVVGIVTGIILSIWRILIKAIVVVHFFVVLFSGKRNKDLAEFSNYWNTQVYKYVRYMTFTTNQKPFPFSELGKNLDKVEMKKNSKKK
jgi:hypothetical protein